MTKSFYIADMSTVMEHYEKFKECHWVLLNEQGQVLVAAKFSHEGMEYAWRNAAGDKAQSLPHMLSRRNLHPDHVKLLAQYGVTETDSTFDAAEKFAVHHPLHGPESY